MNISELTIEQLKALAYDAISEAEFIQKNLSVINGEIAKKKEMEKIKAVPDTAPKDENTGGSAEPEKVKPTKEK